MVGSAQAAEAIKVILSIGNLLVGKLVIIDIKTMQWQNFSVNKDPLCKVCESK